MRQIVTGKSPLHPSALRLKDIHRGMHVIQFNISLGIIADFIVLSEPYVGRYWDSPKYKSDKKSLLVKGRSTHGSSVRNHSVGDLGLVPYYGTNGWNDRNFAIDARKAHLLPKPDEELRRKDEADLDYDKLQFAVA